MKKIIRETDEKLGIQQVTIADERWYMKPTTDQVTQLPTFTAVPSVTWIAGHYPKGVAFYKWLADKGWDESQAIKQAAGSKGSKVHHAVTAILDGYEVRIDSKFVNPETNELEELTLEEVDCIKAFVDWRAELEKEYVVETIARDVTIFSDKYGYAGTIDWIVRLTDKETGAVTVYIVDFKTSQQVWTEYELQVSAYKRPLESGEFHVEGFTEVADIKLAILQIGYRLNKRGFKWNDVEDKFNLFLAARQIWANECEGQQPKKRDYPIVLSPAKPAESEPEVFISIKPDAEPDVETGPISRAEKGRAVINSRK